MNKSAEEPQGHLTLAQLQETVVNIESLPALPTVLSQLMACLQRPPAEIDLDHVVRLVSSDESIAAQCVRMTNSAMFGRRRPVESVHDAVISLGLWRVSDIVFSCGLPATFDPFPKVMERTTFWRHAMGCALVTQHLARLVRSQSSDKAYLAGLLHDLGLLVNATVLPAETRLVIEKAMESHLPIHEIEREVLGFTHSDTGRILGEAWKVSPDIVTVLQYHHEVEAAPSAKDLVALVHLSDLFCREHGLGHGYYEARQIDFKCSPAWLILVQTCRQMGKPYLSRFFDELEDYFIDVLRFVDAAFGPAEHVQRAS